MKNTISIYWFEEIDPIIHFKNFSMFTEAKKVKVEIDMNELEYAIFIIQSNFRGWLSSPQFEIQQAMEILEKNHYLTIIK